jgi:hypothetical protein
MGLLNTILGRSKPVQSNLDSLFALPSASITLQSAAGMSCSGNAGVCFKPPTGQGFEDMQAEVVKLLSMDGAGSLRKTEDNYGYHWIVLEDADIEELVTRVHMVNSSLADAGWGPQLLCSVFGIAQLNDDSDPAELVASPSPSSAPSSADSGDAPPAPTASPSAEAGDSSSSSNDTLMPEPTAGPGRVIPSTAYLVYLFKRGTFYPFVPAGHEKRDTETELRLRSLVSDDLTVETDLDRWFPLWDLPVG